MRIAIFALPLFASFSIAPAAVDDIRITDVTTQAFSVVSVSDEAVLDASVHVFADDQGAVVLTGTLSTVVVSAPVGGSHANGIAKVDVRGLAADTDFFVQVEVTTASGTLLFPAGPPFPGGRTMVANEEVDGASQLIVNDLVRHEVFQADGATPADGAVVLVDAVGLGAAALTGLVGDGYTSPTAVVGLNNLFDSTSGTSVGVSAGQVLQVTEWRGLYCPALQDQALVRFRRAPAHEEIATVGTKVTELEQLDPCFFADTFCDGTVNILDPQRVLSAFGRALGECGFNPDLDNVVDDVINVLDVQNVLNHFGESEPF